MPDASGILKQTLIRLAKDYVRGMITDEELKDETLEAVTRYLTALEAQP